MSWNPHITVAAIIETNNQFLLVEERIAGKLVLNQPAGHLEDNESLLEAAIRETYEETAWHFQPSHLVGIYHWQHPVNKETYVRFSFTGKTTAQDKQANLDPDIEQAIWLSYEEIVDRQSQHRSPLVLTCINDYLAGHRYDLELIHSIY